MANYGHEGYGVSNVNFVAGDNAYSNIQNMNAMLQGQVQDQDQCQVPYVYNNGVLYALTPNNVSNLHTDYAYPHPWAAMAMNTNRYIHPNPPPAMDMNMNGYDGGYYFNQPGTPHAGYCNRIAVNHIQNNHYYHPPAHGSYQLQQQPQLQLQPQLHPGPLFDAGRGRSSGRHSSGRYCNALQAGGSGSGLRENNYIINNNATSSSQVMGNIEERLMRMTISEGERSTHLQGQGEGLAERHQRANAEAAAGFIRENSNAKFFVIKSYSKENVVNSIKHGVWTSTRKGNRKLAQAYLEAYHGRNVNASCPVFLFFSVTESKKFCGVAEMDGPVDFETNANCWDREWKGKFPVKWNIIKDVPSNQFRHITIYTTDNPNQIPVIQSRDTQQVGFKKGREMLEIFNSYVQSTSLLDDVLRSTASSQQQSHHQEQSTSLLDDVLMSTASSQQQSHHQENREEEKQNKKEKNEWRVIECEPSCSGSNSCDTNTVQAQQEAIEDNSSEMQLQEIVNTDEITQITAEEIKINVDAISDTIETQQTDVDSCMKPPKTQPSK